MQDRNLRCSRRKFLAASAAALTLAGVPGQSEEPSSPPPLSRARPGKLPLQGRKPLAILTTVYRPLSHSYHIGGRFLYGYARGGQLHVPKYYIQSMCVDQTPDTDLSRELSREFGFRVTRKVEGVPEALTVDGKLAVEGVLLIAEHGNYKLNDKGQILYPRYEMFEQVVKVFRDTGKTVPVFVDKHLSYSFAKARKMYDWSREMKFGLMAGSSLPVTWRRPELEPKLETPFEDGLIAAYGPIEVYGLHALESLQVMMERRQGGETGVKAVTCLVGKDVWKAGDSGKWSWDLLDAALARSETVNPGDVRKNTGSFPVGKMPPIPPTAFLIEYRDGRRGTVLLLNSHVQDTTFAGKVAGESKPLSCLFYLPAPPGAKFLEAQTVNIEKFLEAGQPPYPAERTLLTTGILDAIMESHHRRGARVETPELDIRYSAPADSGFLRGSVAEG